MKCTGLRICIVFTTALINDDNDGIHQERPGYFLFGEQCPTTSSLFVVVVVVVVVWLFGWFVDFIRWLRSFQKSMFVRRRCFLKFRSATQLGWMTIEVGMRGVVSCACRWTVSASLNNYILLLIRPAAWPGHCRQQAEADAAASIRGTCHYDTNQLKWCTLT